MVMVTGRGRPDQCQGLINDMLDLNGPHVLFALATEIENLLDQIGCPVAGTENAFSDSLEVRNCLPPFEVKFRNTPKWRKEYC